MSWKVLIPQDITPAGKEYLKQNGCEIEVLTDCTVENICRHCADADAMLVRTASYPKEIFEAAKKLKVMARFGAGVDNIDLKAATEHGVQVCNAPIANSNSVAEHTIALILACAKNLIIQDTACRAGDFEARNRIKGRELDGKILGLIGCGHIGQLAAQKAVYGFGMKVIGYDAYADPAKVPDFIRLVADPSEIYKEADFISLHVPLTEQTRNMIDSEIFSMMKPEAVLINCARGGVVNEKDLFEAVKNGKIAGAGLDVFEEEPVTAANPLFELKNIVVTPHNAALTFEASDRMGLHAAQGIIEVLNGKKPTWPVNKL